MVDDREAPAAERADAQAGGARKLTDLAQAIGIAGDGTARATMGAGRPESHATVAPAFDLYHPPEPSLIDDCVHCGFCLPTCHTYLLFGEEMDSPRGRIYLMNLGHEGEPMTDTMVRHWDLCLGCLACVTACPSGVQYEKLIESTRQQVERRYPRSFRDRFFRQLIYTFLPYPNRLRLAAAPLSLYQRSGLQDLVHRSRLFNLLPDRLRAMEGLAPKMTEEREPIPDWTGALGEKRRTVGILLGCVQRVFFPQVNAATLRVLSAEGCVVVSPRTQGCCGALSLHVGREKEAMTLARRTIDAFEASGVENVVVNVAGCGSAMKEYDYLLRDDPRYAERAKRFSESVRDVSELLEEMGPVAERQPLPLTAVYHDACHLAHGQQIRSQPRDLLRGIPGLQLKEVPREREICCGSAGTYNLLEPEPARDLGLRKAGNVLETGADILVTANPGCHLQIQASMRRLGRTMAAAHVVEMLDASIQGVEAQELLR
jgi:glycolate oxidase iron-sulfur subunit